MLAALLAAVLLPATSPGARRQTPAGCNLPLQTPAAKPAATAASRQRSPSPAPQPRTAAAAGHWQALIAVLTVRGLFTLAAVGNRESLVRHITRITAPSGPGVCHQLRTAGGSLAASNAECLPACPHLSARRHCAAALLCRCSATRI